MSEKRGIKLTKFQELSKVVDEFERLSAGVRQYSMLGREGRKVDLNELIYTSRGIYYVLPDTTIKKVILYQAERQFRLNDKAEDIPEPNFHIYACDVVKKQIEQKSKRFKITTRKDGLFLVKDYKFDENMKRKEEAQYKKLTICNLCFIQHNRVKRVNIPREDFNVKEFLEPGYSELTFSYNFDEIPVNYQANWQEIAAVLKEKKHYICDGCGIKVEKLYSEKYLNLHYTSEKLYNKLTDKVKVLCLKCHTDEAGHEHIKEKADYKNFLEFMNKKS